MRSGFMRLVNVLLLLVVFSSAVFAQIRGQAGGAAGNAAGQFDSHDLNGVWDLTRTDTARPFEVGGAIPPMTPEGQKRFDANKPSFGPRAVPPALGNDIIGNCNPSGVPRLLWFVEPFEFIVARDKVVQFFSWERAVREIWTDGRTVPSGEVLENLGPRWYGYSAGKWEGDTFVVDTVGLDERTWLDNLGYPHTDQVKMQERYRRVKADALEMDMTITDPQIYTKPWVAAKRTFALLPKEKLTFNGWTGFLEGICSPLDEQNFNSNVRNPAGGVTGK
jgi:hypothetical protein